MPPCQGDPCVFETDVSVDLRRLPRMAARVPRLTSASAELGFTVLRTFGGGTWLQELQTLRPNGTIFSGTLDHPTPWSGLTPRLGLFPADGATFRRDDRPVPDLQDELHDERLLVMGDSAPPVTTDVRVVATFPGCGRVDSDDLPGASIRTAAGDLVTISRSRGRDFVDATVPLPIGTTWNVGRNTDDPPAGTFEVSDRPLLVTMSYRCPADDGFRATKVAIAEIVGSRPVPGASGSP
jgi:hypothetical protein